MESSTNAWLKVILSYIIRRLNVLNSRLNDHNIKLFVGVLL